MNLYKFARKIDKFINDCQEEAAREFPELGGHLDALDPFTEELHRYPWLLEDKSYHYLDSTNYRVDVFETEEGNLAWAFYSPQAEATNPAVQNSHHSLANVLWERNHLELEKRWCGFYSRIMGNGNDDFLVLYGMSSDYPHNQYADDVLKKFVDKMLSSSHDFSKVIVIDYDGNIKSYTK